MTGKVERAHLRRAAYVYVRQSTMAQVERNTESLERQYELVDRAVALGWAAAMSSWLTATWACRPRALRVARGLSGWWPMSGWARSGSCSGSRSRAWRGATLTGISCLTCAR